MIEARHISHALGGKPVLSDVSFSASPGEHIALVGPNGAGKSTLLQILAGVLVPGSGAVQFSGEDLHAQPLAARARALSYLPQQRELAWDLLAEDVAALGRFAWGGRRYRDLSDEARAPVDQALRDAGAAAFIGRSVRSLSGGEQARVHLARALAGGGHVLLLDEPCAALDIPHQLELMQVLETARQNGQLILTVLHDLELAERFATRLIVLHQGRVQADAPPALDDIVLAQTFGLKRRRAGGFVHA